MKNCRDCLHFKACYEMTVANNADEFNTLFAEKCEDFADRSKWKYTEYKVGDTVWYVDGLYDNAVIRPAIVEYIDIVDKNDKMWLGACVDGDIHIEKEIECFYHTQQEAEKAMERMKENEKRNDKY